MKRAIILDVDGTLIDTNPTHLKAWQDAFDAYGYRIAPQRIWAELGKGGDNLVPDLVPDASAAVQKKIQATHAKRYLELAATTRFAVFRGVLELFHAIHRRRVPVAIATSSNDAHLEAAEKSSGLKLAPLADVLITKSEAPSSKPAPDVINAAVDQLGIRPTECLMVGDTEHDGEASAAARVPFIGVLCGGNPVHLLEQAGARRVYADPLDLADHLDQVLSL